LDLQLEKGYYELRPVSNLKASSADLKEKLQWPVSYGH